jgi:GntR family transcriptional regulator, transcriptional repressor for pyruvate dehydrogenase complex
VCSLKRDPLLVFSDRVDVLAESLRSQIEDGSLEPGAKLPSEREIAERYRLSRNTVREALRELEAVGLVHRRHGSGTYVSEEPFLAFTSSLTGGAGTGDSMNHVMDLRLVIEPGIAKRAAIRAKGQVSKLRSLLDTATEEAARQKPSNAVLRKLDVEFHAELARLSRNPLLSELLAMSNDLMAPSRADEFLTLERVRSSVTWHRRILEAVMERNGDAAFNAMEEHLIDIKGHTEKRKVGPVPRLGEPDEPREQSAPGS